MRHEADRELPLQYHRTKMERNCLPETTSLETLGPCLGGKGKVDVSEGTLVSVPDVTEFQQVGWQGRGRMSNRNLL